jgi:[ribosomal protein S18]-alanine N-acetyltransferase
VAAAGNSIPLPQMRLRPMLDSDVAAVVAIEQRAYPFPWSEGIFRDCLRVGYHCTVLEVDFVLIGYGIVACGAGEAHLLNVCIGEDFRCRGFGRALMEHLLQAAERAGSRLVFLEVRPANVGAIRLYESLNFQQIGVRRGYYQAAAGREDALVMRRNLP